MTGCIAAAFVNGRRFPTATRRRAVTRAQQTDTEREKGRAWDRNKVKLAKERGRQEVKQAKEGIEEGDVTLRAETEEALGTRDVKERAAARRLGDTLW
ncbi:hypothetical protein ERJ75_001573500 [Trypanosoma vivax]|nr:hypothetical protein ERJ75_001573500 [Trypanosoma vivax]